MVCCLQMLWHKTKESNEQNEHTNITEIEINKMVFASKWANNLCEILVFIYGWIQFGCCCYCYCCCGSCCCCRCCWWCSLVAVVDEPIHTMSTFSIVPFVWFNILLNSVFPHSTATTNVYRNESHAAFEAPFILAKKNKHTHNLGAYA